MIWNANASDGADPLWYLILDNVFTGLAALGTIAATGVAVWLAWRTSTEQREQRQEMDRAQAARVVLIIERSVLQIGGMSPSFSQLIARNGSGLPVRKVRAFVLGQTDPEAIATLQIVPADEGKAFQIANQIGVAADTVGVMLFDDDAGISWARFTDGYLHRLAGPVDPYVMLDGNGAIEGIRFDGSTPETHKAVQVTTSSGGQAELVAHRIERDESWINLDAWHRQAR
jgi:hypothetical protein